MLCNIQEHINKFIHSVWHLQGAVLLSVINNEGKICEQIVSTLFYHLLSLQVLQGVLFHSHVVVNLLDVSLRHGGRRKEFVSGVCLGSYAEYVLGNEADVCILH